MRRTKLPLKSIVVILFVALSVVGFYCSYNFYSDIKNQNIFQTESNINQSRQDTTAESTAQDFYAWYLTCLDNHFKNPNGKSPAQDCPYQSSPYVSPTLSAKLAGYHGDPILCAQNTPKSFKVDPASDKNGMKVLVVHTYYSSTDKPLKVTLEKNSQNWLISDIECPK